MLRSILDHVTHLTNRDVFSSICTHTQLLSVPCEIKEKKGDRYQTKQENAHKASGERGRRGRIGGGKEEWRAERGEEIQREKGKTDREGESRQQDRKKESKQTE